MPKLSELIALCAEDEMSVQNLDNNVVEMNIKKGQGYIKFVTDSDHVKNRFLHEGKNAKVGIILWLPPDVFDRYDKKEQPQ